MKKIDSLGERGGERRNKNRYRKWRNDVLEEKERVRK